MLGVPADEKSLLLLSSGRSCMNSISQVKTNRSSPTSDQLQALTADKFALPLLAEHALRALRTIVVHDTGITKRAIVSYEVSIRSCTDHKQLLFSPLLMAGQGHFFALTRSSAT